MQFSGTSGLWDKPEEARKQLDRMHELGMDILILDTVAGGEWAFYPSRLFRQWTKEMDPIRTILEYADAHNMRIYLATGFLDGAWDTREGPEAEALLERHRKVMDEIQSLYGKHPSFSGWYLTYEMVDVQFENRAARQRIVRLFKGLADYAHRVTGGNR